MIPSIYFWFVPVMAQTAQTTGKDSVSLAALGTFVAVVLGAVGAFIAKKKGKEEGKQEELQRRVSIEDQPIGVKLEEKFVTHTDFKDHMDRMEEDISDIKVALEGERSIARLANGNLHKRIDTMSGNLGDRLSKLEGTTEAIQTTTSKLLDIALQNNTQPKGGKQ